MIYSIFKFIGKDDIEQTHVIRFNDDGSKTSFPVSSDNTDYQAYLKWVAEGNTPLPVDE